MTRDVAAATQTAAEDEVIRRIYLARLAFDSGDILVNSWPLFQFGYDWDGDLTDEQFIGVGRLGAISVVEESTDQKAYVVELSLTGIPKARVTEILDTTDYLNKDVRIWCAFLDEDYATIGEPILLFRGRMDIATVELGETATITLPCNSRQLDWERARVRRYTDADQQDEYPGDLFLEFVQQISAGLELKWGRG